MKKGAVNTFFKLRTLITKSKVSISRANSYITILNSGMILFLLLSRLQEYGINVHITRWFFPIFIATLVALAIVGYLDYKLGFHREEIRTVTARNPYMNEIIERLEKIEHKLEEGKRKR